MIQQFNCLSLLILFLFGFATALKAQQVNRFHFLGINPSVTIEPFYEKGEFDINIFPLVYQTALTNQFDIRLNTICNLGIRNNGAQISHFGLETAWPIFFKLKDGEHEISKGFFTAPIISLTRNRIEKHSNIGLWFEPGYNLLFDNNFAMSFGLQLGRTFFNYDEGNNKWGPHFGIKIIIGKWMKRV
jgi:hypothetical protein